jgi:hypothetical protein
VNLMRDDDGNNKDKNSLWYRILQGALRLLCCSGKFRLIWFTKVQQTECYQLSSHLHILIKIIYTYVFVASSLGSQFRCDVA